MSAWVPMDKREFICGLTFAGAAVQRLPLRAFAAIQRVHGWGWSPCLYRPQPGTRQCSDLESRNII